MKPGLTLAFAGSTHRHLVSHLHPGDGNEAAAILICSSSPGLRRRLVVRETIAVPYMACSLRAPDAVVWPGSYIEQAIDVAEPEGLTIILLHSHPGGWLDFSHVDDESDARVIPGIFEGVGGQHGSAVMTADGAVRARIYASDMSHEEVDLVTVADDEIRNWWVDGIVKGIPSGRPMAFTGAMTAELARLSAVVIGVSGTGSIVAEQLARLGFGRIVMVDPDRVEMKNLNRILNATFEDATSGRLKVEMFADAIASFRGPEVAVPIPTEIGNREAVETVAQCDVIFSCVDSQDGRQFADLIASAFLIPLFDVGVVIPTYNDGGKAAIGDVCGRIDYVHPGGSTLADRSVYTPEGLRAEYMRRVNPKAYEEELAAGYIKGVVEEAPSVITLNMRASSAVVAEFVARTFPFRQESNGLYARTIFSLAACDEDHFSEEDFERKDNRLLGRGAAEPLLGLPALRREGKDTQ
ncbi:uncharacterized UPF0146 family protein [Aminobacter niigataensis]|uniref:Uncharacterized UPF0146 family protein n=1 Tax=Aminobacter niigataensis TaxID=83265 RepID=A0ABR6L331_9HYPH|nr:ThiF family adenylyltransferase [Aminobacter niigataensis]MBB4650594.1 uncharacterized UPF0146 family protein [Aminobacter niigataensis]